MKLSTGSMIPVALLLALQSVSAQFSPMVVRGQGSDHPPEKPLWHGSHRPFALNSPENPALHPDMDWDLIRHGVNPDADRLAIRSVRTLHAEQKVLNNITPILWRGGCGPTAAAMNLLHWESKGFTKVFGSMRQHRRPDVSAQQDPILISASEEHMRDYFYPTDTPANILPDRSGSYKLKETTLPDGTTTQSLDQTYHFYHRQPNCMADLLGTSMAFYGAFQGSTDSFAWPFGAVGWISRVAPDYNVRMTIVSWEGFDEFSDWIVTPKTGEGWEELHHPQKGSSATYDRFLKFSIDGSPLPYRIGMWNALKSGIDNGRSMVAFVNSKAGEYYDHAVLVVGYKQDANGKQYYATYNTWTMDVTWYECVPMTNESENHPAFTIWALLDLEISLKEGATNAFFAPGVLHEFYNIKTGAYFFTGSSNEAAWVYNQTANWKYQGPAFHIEGAPDAGTGKPSNVPVYRFYNSRSRSHFYTASPSERDNVIRDLAHTYSYEGIAFYARTWQDSSQRDRPVHRFYVHPTASHFFSANPQQVEHLKRYADPKYITYEGVAWFAPRAQQYVTQTWAGEIDITQGSWGDTIETITHEDWTDYNWIPNP